jgi:hypothetical protein
VQSLDDFVSQFAGYGHLHAPLWFIGMEEGGGRDVDELQRRIATWKTRGSRTLEDLGEFHHAVGEPRYFVPPHPLQPTWGPLCRTLQAWRGAPTDVESLKHVQATELGAQNGAATLLELLPLPAASTSAWPYASLASEHPLLADRAGYAASYAKPRIQLIRTLIDQGKPAAVVFYGLRYLAEWCTIAGRTLQATTIAERDCFLGSNGIATFIAVPHPVARGLKNEFWAAIGTRLRAASKR